MKYVSVAEMVAIEEEADARGHTYSEMMELAGRGLAETVAAVYGKLEKRFALGLVGSGNNGGDTLVALCYLQKWGWQTTAYLVRKRLEDDHLLRRAKDYGCEILEFSEDKGFLALSKAIQTHTVMLDGILGTGFRLPLRGSAKEVLSFIKKEIDENNRKINIVAVDCPSAVDCDSGEAAPDAIAADITVTMAAIKQGLLKFPAYKLVGDLRCIDIGLPSGLSSHDSIRREVIYQDWVQKVIPDRPLDAHKSTFGVVMVIAGSLHYSGAALLTGEAAFRSGAGWVTLAIPEPLHAPLAGRFVEATWLPLTHFKGWISENASSIIFENLDRVTTLVIGPGLGLNATTKKFIQAFLEDGGKKLPNLVFDADGLKILAEIQDWYSKLPDCAVLTPHPGEMAVLTGKSIHEIAEDRVAIAESYAQKWGHVVVLKGAFTVIASPWGESAIIPVATPALARAGTGDVLAGLIGGFRAQGLNAFEAAVVGAWIHGRAGLQAAQNIGSTASVLAGDVLEAVKDVMAVLEVK